MKSGPNPFDLLKQVDSDPFYKIWRGLLKQIPVEDLFSPQIPTLLPKDLKNMSLTHLNSTNNYLGTALASMAIQEELIYLLLDCDSLKEDHKYKVIQTEMGERKFYQIDDTILCLTDEKGRKQPLFICSKGMDIWAMILEKFYAQKFGLYTSILCGKPYHLIYNFLDGEYKVYELNQDKIESIWNFLMNHFNGKGGDSKDEIKEFMNVNTNERKKIIILNNEHSSDESPNFRCYIIEDVKHAKVVPVALNQPDERANKRKKSGMTKYQKMQEMKRKKQKKKSEKPIEMKYIKLKLIDRDEFLRPILKEEWTRTHEANICPSQYTKSFFWVNYKLLSRYFSSISINNFKLMNLDNRYMKSMMKMSLEGDHSCVLINFEIESEEDKVIIGIHQKNYKFFANIKPEYKYSNLRMILLKLEKPEETNLNHFNDLTKTIFEENAKNGIFISKFNCSMDHINNFLKDIFLKAKLKKGNYLLAVEVFWESPDYRNINISLHTQLNELIPLKLISSGSNFDIVFYKAFMSYYLQILETNKLGEFQSKSFKTKKITIASDLSKKMKEVGYNGRVRLEYLELMNGFYIVVGNLYFNSMVPSVKLMINKQFHDIRYIISPELINLLNGEITGIKEMHLSMKQPLFFILVRTSLHSKFRKRKEARMSQFFDQYYIQELPSNAGEIFKDKEKVYNEILQNLYFEHFFFKNLIDATIPCIRKSDKELLEGIASDYIRTNLLKIDDVDMINKISYQFNLKTGNNQDGQNSQEDSLNDSLSFLEMTEETFKNLIKKYGRKNVRMWSMKTYQIFEYVFHSDNFLAFFFENKEDKIFYEEIKTFEAENLEIDDHDINSEPYCVNLSPGETHLLVCKLAPNKSHYKYKYKTQFKLHGFYN